MGQTMLTKGISRFALGIGLFGFGSTFIAACSSDEDVPVSPAGSTGDAASASSEGGKEGGQTSDGEATAGEGGPTGGGTGTSGVSTGATGGSTGSSDASMGTSGTAGGGSGATT